MVRNMHAHFNLSVRAENLQMFLEFQELYKDNTSKKIVELIAEHMADEGKKQKRISHD